VKPVELWRAVEVFAAWQQAAEKSFPRRWRRKLQRIPSLPLHLKFTTANFLDVSLENRNRDNGASEAKSDGWAGKM
jgi:hypothetical protein